MARCGCASSTGCSCVVQQGNNITVTGTGSPDNAYVISAVIPDVAGSAYNLDDFFVPDFQPMLSKATGVGNDSGAFPAGCWVKPNGEVVLRGLLTRGSSTYASDGSIIQATLPVEARPAKSVYFVPATNYSGSLDVNTRISISVSGNIYLFCEAGLINWFSLDGITYYTGS